MAGRAAAPPAAPRREAGAYLPRRPERTVLYRTVAETLETFLARPVRHGRRVPRFVEHELRRFLECGIPAHGFLRLRCDACRTERLVPFSCKGRGFCPSCGGRRMADTAAHLVDRVLPVAPVRQWVLTLPWTLRYRAAYDPGLTSDLLRAFVRAVFSSLRRRARHPARRLRCGAVTFVQRFGDALNLNLHFHTLALDGVYVRDGSGVERFLALPPPDDAEVLRIAARVCRGVARVLRRRGLQAEADPEEVDPLAEREPLLATLAAASVRGRIATGRRSGQAVLRFGDRVEVDALSVPATRCAVVAGFSIHANVAVPARDRQRLERLCRYVSRPPVATERLERLPDGRLLYRLKRRWSDGTTAVIFEPLELLEKLAAIVPPPRVNMVRYHGVLAPAAKRRNSIVPSQSETSSAAGCGCSGRHEGSASTTVEKADTIAGETPERRAKSRPRYYSWPELMRRVFAVDVLECPECGSAMRILAAIHPPEATRAILECLGLPARAPPLTPPEADPAEFDDWDFEM